MFCWTRGGAACIMGRKKEVHAMSLYDVVHAPRPRKRDRKLHILIAIGLILVLAAFIPIPWAMHL